VPLFSLFFSIFSSLPFIDLNTIGHVLHSFPSYTNRTYIRNQCVECGYSYQYLMYVCVCVCVFLSFFRFSYTHFFQ
jgi:hypothetical protein